MIYIVLRTSVHFLLVLLFSINFSSIIQCSNFQKIILYLNVFKRRRRCSPTTNCSSWEGLAWQERRPPGWCRTGLNFHLRSVGGWSRRQTRDRCTERHRWWRERGILKKLFCKRRQTFEAAGRRSWQNVEWIRRRSVLLERERRICWCLSKRRRTSFAEQRRPCGGRCTGECRRWGRTWKWRLRERASTSRGRCSSGNFRAVIRTGFSTATASRFQRSPPQTRPSASQPTWRLQQVRHRSSTWPAIRW